MLTSCQMGLGREQMNQRRRLLEQPCCPVNQEGRQVWQAAGRLSEWAKGYGLMIREVISHELGVISQLILDDRKETGHPQDPISNTQISALTSSSSNSGPPSP